MKPMLKTVYLWKEAWLPEVVKTVEYEIISDTETASSDIAELASMVKWMDMIGRILIYLTAIFLLLTVVAQLYIWFYR